MSFGQWLLALIGANFVSMTLLGLLLLTYKKLMRK